MLGFATVQMQRYVVTFRVCCAISRVHPQFLASLSGVNLYLLWTVFVSPMLIHLYGSPGVVAVDAIRKLDCSASVKVASQDSTWSEKMLAICIKYGLSRLYESTPTVAMNCLSDASPGLCNRPASSVMDDS